MRSGNSGDTFAFNRGQAIRHNFGYNLVSEVEAGVEGRKFIAEVESRRGKHGRYFFKQMHTDLEAFDQCRKWEFFKRAEDVLIPEVFKPVRLKRNEPYMLMSDLTEGGQYWVLSGNNPELKDPAVWNIIRSMPPATKKKIAQQLVRIAEVAANPDFDQPRQEGVYTLQMSSLMFVIDPGNPADAKVGLADFGDDVTRVEAKSKDRILEANLKTVFSFYSFLTGEQCPTSEEHRDLAEKAFSLMQR